MSRDRKRKVLNRTRYKGKEIKGQIVNLFVWFNPGELRNTIRDCCGFD